MVRSKGERRTVVFECDARGQNVPRAIYIAGETPELGSWSPNRIALRDDGNQGDSTAGDGIWTIRVDLPAGKEIEYKYTNSGDPGRWAPGDESAGRNRKARITPGNNPLILKDKFGDNR